MLSNLNVSLVKNIQIHFLCLNNQYENINIVIIQIKVKDERKMNVYYIRSYINVHTSKRYIFSVKNNISDLD